MKIKDEKSVSAIELELQCHQLPYRIAPGQCLVMGIQQAWVWGENRLQERDVVEH